MERSWVRGSSIGAGAFGAVHLAYAKAARQVFAVKSVSLSSAPPASLQSLENEIRVLRSIRSPHVVAYLGDDTTLDSPGGAARRNLHLEFMPGGTAADAAAVSRANGSSFPHVRDRVRCVARALRYLHDVAGVVHCDVKGRNVLLGRDPGVAKLADFGMAVRIAVACGGCGWARGTPLWMAPEVARGERPTPAADVWSLGCTVIEMATGAPPWPGLSAEDAAGAMLRIGYGRDVPEFPAQMSETGRDFLDKCLRRDARKRWTAEQLLRHPFLTKEGGAAAAAVDDLSPRGVLEWANWGFHDDDHSIEERCNLDSEDEILHCAKERMRGLDCGGGGAMNWCSNGWELVWSSESKSMAEREEEVEEGEILEEAQRHELGGGDGSRIRCSVSFCFCCHFLRCSSSSSPCCWKSDFGSQNWIRIWKPSEFDLCNFLSELMEINKITHSFNFEIGQTQENLLDSENESKFDPKISKDKRRIRNTRKFVVQ